MVNTYNLQESKNGLNNMAKMLYTAIVFLQDYKVPVIKYRKIGNVNTFVEFIQKKYTTATKINFYDRSTREFRFRVTLPK